jgi:hypothetical protein
VQTELVKQSEGKYGVGDMCKQSEEKRRLDRLNLNRRIIFSCSLEK